MADRTKATIVVLVVIILILAGALVYALIFGPAVSRYTVNAQTQGYAIAVAQIIQLAAQCQVVPLTSGNVTINVIAVECLQQPQQQAAQ